jgi:hypothetical protein
VELCEERDRLRLQEISDLRRAMDAADSALPEPLDNIRRRLKAAVVNSHPDRGGCNEDSVRANSCYDVFKQTVAAAQASRGWRPAALPPSVESFDAECDAISSEIADLLTEAENRQAVVEASEAPEERRPAPPQRDDDRYGPGRWTYSARKGRHWVSY